MLKRLDFNPIDYSYIMVRECRHLVVWKTGRGSSWGRASELVLEIFAFVPFLPRRLYVTPREGCLSPNSHETIHSPFLGDNKGCFLGFLTKRGTKGSFFPKYVF